MVPSRHGATWRNGLQEPVSIPSLRSAHRQTLWWDWQEDDVWQQRPLPYPARRRRLSNTVTILPPSPACSYLTPTISTGTSRWINFWSAWKKKATSSGTFPCRKRQRLWSCFGLNHHLPSIVDEETANSGEKPMIAGMYYSRYECFTNAEYPERNAITGRSTTLNMPGSDWLSASTTTSIIKGPYNTYKSPVCTGPIRIPGIQQVSIVLMHVTSRLHLYMCARRISARS